MALSLLEALRMFLKFDEMLIHVLNISCDLGRLVVKPVVLEILTSYWTRILPVIIFFVPLHKFAGTPPTHNSILATSLDQGSANYEIYEI